MTTKEDSFDELVYIYPVPKGLVTNCPVCFVSLYQDPFVNGECGHHLCGSCSKRLKFCPECRVGLKTHPDKSLQRVLKSLSVYCNKKNEGCQWEGELGDLQHHQENDCAHAVIRCATCDLEGPRHQISIHQSEKCIFRIVSCGYCNHEYSWSNLNSHYDHCSEYIIECSQCSASITRGYEKTHKNEVCPLAYVRCVAFQYGCQWEGYRRAMDDHVKDNLVVHFNLCLQQCSKNEGALASCKDAIKELESEVKKKNQEITLLRHKLESEVRKKNQEITLLRQKLESEVKEKNQEITLLRQKLESEVKEKNEEITLLRHKLESEVKKKNQEITLLRQKLESEVKKKNEEITLLRQKVTTLEVDSQCLLKTKIPLMANEMKKKMVTWQNAAENDLRKELTDYIDEILSSGEETDEEDDDDDDLSQGSGSLWGDADTVKQKPTFIYELNDFFKFKSKKKCCLSPPFYANGYHMGVRVHPNGYGKGEGSHVSVYVCLLKGSNDHTVQWPFKGQVIIDLLHGSNGRPHRRIVKYEHDTPVDFSTVAKGPAKGNGCPKFISNQKLSSYRVSSTLRFEIFVSCK